LITFGFGVAELGAFVVPNLFENSGTDRTILVSHAVSAPRQTTSWKSKTESPPDAESWRATLHRTIFEADTKAGRAFDVALLWAIGASVIAVCLESVAEYRVRFGLELKIAEWVFTILFTLEYIGRILAVRRPLRYATSFFGIVDLLSILPTYLSVIIPGTQSLLVIRALRLLRVFRILKLTHFVGEARMLNAALRASTRKITVFLLAVLTTVLVVGALMYVVEGEKNGFTSIPMAIYWAVVTMTTVGYGDITPHTVLGKFIATLLMVLGYGIIAVPTGIVSVELGHAARMASNTQACPSCGAESHADDARYCRRCGAKL
jgi:voltage-gated potassium channel